MTIEGKPSCAWFDVQEQMTIVNSNMIIILEDSVGQDKIKITINLQDIAVEMSKVVAQRRLEVESRR